MNIKCIVYRKIIMLNNKAFLQLHGQITKYSFSTSDISKDQLHVSPTHTIIFINTLSKTLIFLRKILIIYALIT